MSNIDCSQLITKAMKDAATAQLAAAKAELSARNARALPQIERIQDRIDTIGFGIDIDEAPPEMKKKGRPDCPAESLEGLQVRTRQGDHAAWRVRVFSMAGRTANP